MPDSFIPVAKPTLDGNELKYVVDAVTSGWISSAGAYIEQFERRFAEFCGSQYAVATSNGTVALHLAIAAYGFGAGDEVIVPNLTYVATANAVRYTGATPVFVDVDADTLCISAECIEAAVTARTRGIIAVHLYGHPANMTEINRVATAHGLRVIEDAAEAHGATVAGRRVGALGDCGAFSFYGNKLITTGEGGMLVTDDAHLYERARHLRDQAMSPTRRYWHDEIGFNYRMTNLQAAIGVAQMEQVHDRLAQKRRVFETYQRTLGRHPKLKINSEAPWARNVYWMVCAEAIGFDRDRRDRLMQDLHARGVDSRPFFYPCTCLPMYSDSGATTPVTDVASARGLNLPSYGDLSDDDIAYISDTLSELIG